jgi:hypothetical protein
MANLSTAVVSTDVALAAQYNNVRLDAIGPYNAERVWNDNEIAAFGTLGADGKIYSNGTDFILDALGGGNINFQVSGTTRLSVTSTGFNLVGDMLFNDNEKATFGDAADASIYWDGTKLVVGGSVVQATGLSVTEAQISDLGTTVAMVADNLSVFAATTSAQLRGIISNETGTGSLVFGTSPTLVTPALGTPSALVATNATGTAAGLTAGNVTTNANLTGHVTSVGNAAVLGSFTKAQLDAAVSDGNVTYDGDITQYTDALAIAAVEAELTLTLAGVLTATSPVLTTPDLGTPSALVGTNISGTAAGLTAGNATLAATVTTNANLTGHVTSTGNAAVLGSFTKAQLSAAVSDGTPLYSGDITIYTDAEAIAAVEGEATLVLQSGTTIGGSLAATVANKLSDFTSTTSASPLPEPPHSTAIWY